MAALVSGHNTYTHSPLSDTTALRYDRHEFNFHSDFQSFSILSGHCLVYFMLRHYYFLLDISDLLQAEGIIMH
jgi:hypothetical protein